MSAVVWDMIWKRKRLSYLGDISKIFDVNQELLEQRNITENSVAISQWFNLNIERKKN